jgi:hypothetical protein
MKNQFRLFIVNQKKSTTPIFTGVFIILVMLRILLITGIPKILIYGPHDDLFFAKAAHFIIHGQWMGPYTQMTLIKVPFYSFFLIYSLLTGLPLFLNETIFYTLACIVTFYAFSPLIKNRWLRLLLFIIVLFAPASLIIGNNLRVYRSYVYISITLFVVAFSIGLFLRLDKRIPSLLLWSIGLGVSMGAFMITREEGVWIYPVLFLLFIMCIIFIWGRKLDYKIWRSFLVVLPVILWYIPIIIISSLNYSYYGFRGTTEQLDPYFIRVINVLGRIETSTAWHPAVQIHHEALAKAYEMSPLMNSLKDAIENNWQSWNYWDDQALLSKPAWYKAQYAGDGDDISNGHFIWLLRDAVYLSDYYADGKYPLDFYKKLANELETACNIGNLKCSPPKNIPFIGSIDRRGYPIILRMFFENIPDFLHQDFIGINPLSFNTYAGWPENYDDYKYFEEFIYNSLDGSGNPEHATQSLVDGSNDLRLRILLYKGNIMTYIFNVYKGLTLPVLVTIFIIWIFLLLLLISKKRKEHQESYLIISLFIVGLFVSRLMTLTIVDATTSTSGIYYSEGNFLFVYIFSFLVLDWMVNQLNTYLVRARAILNNTDNGINHS